MKIGFYSGSFDPFTFGHLQVIKSASSLFDKLVIGIGINHNKSRRFNEQKMKMAIDKLLKQENLSNCECVIYSELTADVAKEYGADFLVRGLRNGTDYDYEENLASINKELSDIDTIYFRADKLGAISSSMVYELIKREKDVSKYVPNLILEELDIKTKN